MKIQTITSLIIGLSFCNAVFCQDTIQNQKRSENHTYKISRSENSFYQPSKPRIYRDTRLGGSSPKYNTYKKNDYGAGAITTNPNKASGGVATYPDFHADSSKTTNKIYRDTRLGGSSPKYDTYKKNDKGAGAITTNPKKGSGQSSTPSIDSSRKGK